MDMISQLREEAYRQAVEQARGEAEAGFEAAATANAENPDTAEPADPTTTTDATDATDATDTAKPAERGDAR